MAFIIRMQLELQCTKYLYPRSHQAGPDTGFYSCFHPYVPTLEWEGGSGAWGQEELGWLSVREDTELTEDDSQSVNTEGFQTAAETTAGIKMGAGLSWGSPGHARRLHKHL